MVIKYSLKLEAEIQMPWVGHKKKSFAINGNNHTDVNFIEYGYGSRSQGAKAVKGIPVRCSGMCIGLVRPGLTEKQPEAAGIIRALESQTKQQTWVLEVLRLTGASPTLQSGFPLTAKAGETCWEPRLTSSKQAHCTSKSQYFALLPTWPSADLQCQCTVSRHKLPHDFSAKSVKINK